MRHFYPALLGIAMAMMPAHADTTDLLEGAVTADDSYYYNPDSFYAFWQGQYADGTFPGGNARPYSICGEVLSGWAITYNGQKYDIGGSDENGFSVGLPVIVLDWPTYNEAHPFRDFSYSFPIDVTVPGKYTLRGCARALTANKLSSTPPSTVNQYQIMVFLADTQPGNKTIEVVDHAGVPALEVRDDSGALMSSGFTPLPAHSLSTETYPFEINLELNTETKFLTLYAPTRLAVVGALSLLPADGTSVDPILTEDMSESHEIYDLSGRRIRTDRQPASGIYIQVSDGKSRKVVVK